MNAVPGHAYQLVVDEIVGMPWQSLSQDELMAAMWAYYYFSIQFRESLELVCALHPHDPMLLALRRGECDTDNLSPFPDVALPGERMNHDEFMRRTLKLADLDSVTIDRLTEAGLQYLAETRSLSEMARAMSIPTYEDGGLGAVFCAMLSAPNWDHPALKAFRHFLEEHIRFDSDVDNGHGALSRHLVPDSDTYLLWQSFRDLFLQAVPSFSCTREKVFA